jgi:hypothetical protein
MPLSILVNCLAALVVLVLPGYAIRVWFPAREQNPLKVLAEAVGLSLSLSALLGLATFLFDLYLSKVTLFSFYLLAGLMAGIGQWCRRPSFSLSRLQFFAFTAFLILVVWRFLQIRELVLPAWVDSPNHVLIIRKIIEGQEVPRDLLPYMPVPFYYHFGFHVVTALFSFWAGLSPDQSTLILGQILSACICLSIYRLGLALWREEVPAFLAALLTGFVSQMPAYYAAWGRYTLLTGLVLLPLAMAVALELKEGQAKNQGMVMMGVFMSGLVLTHYFAAFLFLLFWVILWGFSIRQAHSMKEPGAGTNRLLLGLGLGLLLASPWIYRILDYGWNYLQPKVVLPTRSLEQAYFPDYGSYLLYLLGPWRNYILILLGVFGFWQAWRSKSSREFLFWTFLLGLGVIPWGVRLIPFRPDHLAIVLFVPVTLLAGWSLSRVITKWKRIGVTLTLVLLFWGLVGTWNLIRPDTILADRADLQALHWIDANIPKEARFLINVTPWAWGTYRGVDGGAWILPFTGRDTLLPTLFYPFGGKGFRTKINNYASQAQQLSGCTPELWNLIKNAGITHLYLKSSTGALTWEALKSCPGLKILYMQEGVTILEVQRPFVVNGYLGRKNMTQTNSLNPK